MYQGSIVLNPVNVQI